jgi:transposase
LRTDEFDSKLYPIFSKNSIVCIEALNGSFELAHRIRPYVSEVFVLNPADIKVSNKKTDKVDARKLVNMLKYHFESNDTDDHFPVVYIPEKHIIQLRSLFSTDKILKKQIVSYKNRILSIFKSYLMTVTRDDVRGKKLYALLDRMSLPESAISEIKLLRRLQENVEIERKVLQNDIISHACKYCCDEITLLVSIPGLSILGACAIMADVGDIKRFSCSKKLASYLRSVPTIKSSNDRIHIGGITKRGRKLSYELILQGIEHTIRYSLPLNKFFEEKIKGKRRVVVRAAIVRKIIESIYYILQNKEIYRFYNEKNYMSKLKLLRKYGLFTCAA